jgi:hypothetical protein
VAGWRRRRRGPPEGWNRPLAAADWHPGAPAQRPPPRALAPGTPHALPPPAPARQALNPFSGAGGTIRYWEEGELVDLVNAVGLAGYERERSRMFVMFAATKPGGAGAS